MGGLVVSQLPLSLMQSGISSFMAGLWMISLPVLFGLSWKLLGESSGSLGASSKLRNVECGIISPSSLLRSYKFFRVSADSSTSSSSTGGTRMSAGGVFFSFG